ncbi:Bug family tripartite tricarboxylate transporter substrate binding protein [Ramlibacter sp.]|uniref:Bug family tripartite tricarboxylate transporter substrate binding protein n=1 Tax=Ramlibacter sp. TaxID=1917967 RepID=UPI003D0B76C5
MNTTRRTFLAQAAATTALASVAPHVHAQAWPARPVRFVLGLPPGGGTDATIRVIAAALKDRIGPGVVVDNVTGAGGTIASANVARAAPDGYTFEVKTVSAAVINSFVYTNLAYQPVNDFKAVSLIGRAPLVAAVPGNLPARNLAEFVALLKANPKKYSYGSSGIGTITHFAGEMFNRQAGVEMMHVPYRGNGPAMAGLLAGDVALIFDTVGSTKQHLQSGKLRSLGVTTAKPTEFLPGSAPIGATVPGFAMDTWFGIYAPAKMPKDIVDRMSAEIAAVMKQPAIAERVKELGYEPAGSTPEEFDRFWREELDRYGPLVKQMDVKVN